MQKVYKGYELMKAIANDKIKVGTKFKCINEDQILQIIFDGTDLMLDGSKDNLFDRWILIAILDSDFEVIENEEKIDIQNIEEYDNRAIECTTSCIDTKNLARKCNELIKATKQLDKNIKCLAENVMDLQLTREFEYSMKERN